MINNYDPNVKWADHEVVVELRQWQYGRIMVVKVGGNGKGKDILETAIGNVVEEVMLKMEEGGFVMTATNGDNIRLDLSSANEREVEAMVVSATIVSVTPQVKVAKKTGRAVGPTQTR